MEPLTNPIQSSNISKVFISGIHGLHPIEKGIAYYYRGHYIYGQTFIPIEPLPFASKQKINLAGMAGNVAPHYNKSDPNLVPEVSINALHRAQMNEYYFGQGAQHPEQDYNSAIPPKSKTDSNPQSIQPSLASEIHGAMSMPTSHQVPNPRGTTTAWMPNIIQENKVSTSGVDLVPQHRGFSQGGGSGYFVPHDRANYLANSAPGSRIMSRNPSPTGFRREDGFRRAMESTTRLYELIRDTEPSLPSATSSRTFDRPATSSARMNHLLDEEGIVRSTSMDNITNLAASYEWMGEDELFKHMYPPYRLQNDPESPCSESTVKNETKPQHESVGLAPDHLNIPETRDQPSLNLRTQPLSSESGAAPPKRNLFEISQGLPAFSHRHLYMSYFKAPSSTYTNTGRPLASSMALNKAYNLNNPENSSPYLFSATGSGDESAAKRVTRCPLHGDECDGVTVANLHVTEDAKRTRGFKEQYPAIMSGGRKMINWHALLEEESRRLE